LCDRLEGRLEAAQARPPHGQLGDPRPPREGPHEEGWGEPLDAAPAGSRFRVDRVSDRDSAALRYLGELGIYPGVVIMVEEQAPFGGPRWVRVGENRHALGPALTRLVHGHEDPE